jgi:transmembrane sensor
MNRPEPPSAKARRNSLAAAAWVERRERGLSPEEQDEFLQWLAADPLHGQWLALHQRTANTWTRLSDWRPEHSQRPNPDLLAPAQRTRWFVPAGLAVAAGLVMAFIWRQPRVESTSRASSGKAVADYERKILEDGSAVELNRGALIEVRFTASERRVVLTNGEALFTVIENPARPFIVHARGAEVRAVGTAFNVRLDAATMEVLVTQGRVEVASPQFSGGKPQVASGYRAIVSLTSPEPPRITAVTAEETARLLAWQPQLLDFSSTPLDRVLAEFNRRNRIQLVLADPTLSEVRVVATVRSDNVEGLMRFLADEFGVRAEPRGHGEILLRRK